MIVCWLPEHYADDMDMHPLSGNEDKIQQLTSSNCTTVKQYLVSLCLHNINSSINPLTDTFIQCIYWVNNGSLLCLTESHIYYKLLGYTFLNMWTMNYIYPWASQVALVVKNPPANTEDKRDASLIPGMGRSPGEGHGNPLRYSCLENPMDRETQWPIHQRVSKTWAQMERLSTDALLWMQCKFL